MMFLLVLALMAFLPLLALLQYRWLGEVSRGEHERMKSNLQSSVAQFVRDFDNEIKNIYIQFQSGFSLTGHNPDTEIADQYSRWRSRSAHPNLVSEIYQTFNGGSGGIDLLRFNQTDRRFEPAEWPAKLSRLRSAFLNERAMGETAQKMIGGIIKGHNPVPNGKAGTFIHITPGPVYGEIPAIVIHNFAPQTDSAGYTSIMPGVSSYRIIVLDKDYISNRFLPELSERYFSISRNSDYNLAVIENNEHSKTIFRSNPDISLEMMGKGDASETLMKLKLTEPDRMIIAGIAGNNLNGEKSAIGIIQSNMRIVNRSPSSERKITARSVLNLNDKGPWLLVAKHRAGSLEAAVAGARRRNLAVSFGILILLGVSMGLILISSRRVQRLARQQMEFVAGVSHELRTPIAVICSAAENLADGVVDDNEQIKRYGGLIRDEGRRLTGMVEQVLEFAGAQSGRNRYKMEPISIADAVEDALNACRMGLIEGGFEVEKNYSKDLPLVMADISAISRAVQNLLNNAIKYSGEGRWIGIELAKIDVGNSEEVRIAVSDRGIGITSRELSNIFEPFYRGQKVISDQIRGNGLGLSLVKQIVDSHGGRVSVISTPNEGSTFTIHLPAYEIKEEEAELKVPEGVAYVAADTLKQ